MAKPPPSLRPLGSGEVWVPAANWSLPNGQQLLCGGGGFVQPALLHGSLADARITWVTLSGGRRIEVAWPPGYSARFNPALELLDEDAVVVGHEGSPIEGGCQTAETDVWWVNIDTRPATLETPAMPPMTAEP